MGTKETMSTENKQREQWGEREQRERTCGPESQHLVCGMLNLARQKSVRCEVVYCQFGDGSMPLWIWKFFLTSTPDNSPHHDKDNDIGVAIILADHPIGRFRGVYGATGEDTSHAIPYRHSYHSLVIRGPGHCTTYVRWAFFHTIELPPVLSPSPTARAPPNSVLHDGLLPLLRTLPFEEARYKYALEACALGYKGDWVEGISLLRDRRRELLWRGPFTPGVGKRSINLRCRHNLWEEVPEPPSAAQDFSRCPSNP
ncbi:hypothetical protein BU17DRAFT_69321 [Hysterangium stoloniferum]|nr:hypothetical protein BU17DRAFT_69321 [Hysterangium stoloniferum]